MLITILFIIGIVLSLGLAAFFSAAETSITTASPSIIHKLSMQGNARARFIQKLHNNKEAMISVILLCSNSCNSFLSAIITTFFVNLVGNEGLFYATVITTFGILIFAEVLPKSYAFENAESFALRIAPIMKPLFHLLLPVTILVAKIVRFLNVLFRLDKKIQVNYSISSLEELRGTIDLYHKDGKMYKEHRDMLDAVLELDDIRVDKVMIHRSKVQTININDNIDHIISSIAESRFTRFPVWEGKEDNIIGILHGKNLIRTVLVKKDITKNDLLSILTEPWFVPEYANIKNQLNEFRKKRIHFAIVVNEHGDIQGILTLEDIIEEIVGSIEDEHDPINTEIALQDDGSYLISGEATIRDVNRVLDWKLEDARSITVSGMLTSMNKVVPRIGDEFITSTIKWQVIEMKHNKIILVRASAVKV